MLTIIIGIVLSFACYKLSMRMVENGNKLGNTFASMIVLILFSAIILGVYMPLNNYQDWELVEETKLVAHDTREGNKYVIVWANTAYTYRYEIESEHGTATSKEYKTKVLTGQTVEEIEDAECEIPLLLKYEREAKRSIWTFGLNSNETKYVFYVPEGAILMKAQKG